MIRHVRAPRFVTSPPLPRSASPPRQSQRRSRLVRALELADNTDHELLEDISRRRTELTAEHAQLTEQLQQLRDTAQDQPNPQLLNTLPVGPCDLAALPEPLARRLFEARRLEIHYDKTTHTARYRITLTGKSLPAATGTAWEAIAATIAKNTDEDGDGPSHWPGPFPSVGCPRQDSNLRHPL